ncbi:chymotrypsinogen [Acrasis kona]|uniref:Chymotrypsinogen n=1 Tax=Acrasis kona TaxID=1008807 RepID=A0AAW2ZSC9_9EUKA
MITISLTKLLILCFSVSLVTCIFNGIPVQQGEFPYLAYIIVNTDTGGYTCGGGIVSSKYVISAAHCTYGSSYQIILGRIDVNGYRRADLYNVKSVRRPDDFGSLWFDYNDVAVFELDRDVPENPGYIEYMNIGLQSPPEGATVNIAGFGFLAGQTGTTIAHKGTLPVAQNSDCNVFDSFNSTYNFCANDPELYTCAGDSGIPYVIKPTGSDKWVSVGINSYTSSGLCGSRSPQGVVARISTMIQYITDNTQDAPPKFVNIDYSDWSVPPTPTPTPTQTPTPTPTQTPTPTPTPTLTPTSTPTPTFTPTLTPTPSPTTTITPTPTPTRTPTTTPTSPPTPTSIPTTSPTFTPTTFTPTTRTPTANPTSTPTSPNPTFTYAPTQIFNPTTAVPTTLPLPATTANIASPPQNENNNNPTERSNASTLSSISLVLICVMTILLL